MIRERLFGEFHSDVVDAVSAFATFLESTGDIPTARAQLDRAVQLAVTVFGFRHTTTQKLLHERTRLGG